MKVKIKDPQNVPALFLKALSRDYHAVDGDISVTELISPPQIRVLKKLDFTAELDSSHEIWRMIGPAMHGMLEDAGYSGAIDSLILKKAAGVLTAMYNNSKDKKLANAAKWLKDLSRMVAPADGRFELERTLSYRFPEFGMKLYGTFDVKDNMLSRIEDYKLTKSWAFKFQEEKDEWEQQQNVYRYMLYKETGEVIDSLRIWGVFRDWNGAHVIKKNYPPRPIMPIDLNVWDMDRAEQFVRTRLELHSAAANGEIVLCSGKDRWAESEQYKIYRPGLKTALFSTDNEDIAKDRLSEIELRYPGAYIESIPGINKRCREYCPVAQVCQQWKNIQEKIKNG